MKTEDKTYLAYYELKETKLYYNQIKEHTGKSHSSTQNALENLVKKKILRQIKTKSNTFYEINDKKLFALKFSEIAMQKFNKLNANTKTPLRNFLKNIPNEIYTIVLFGSASRKEENKESDIDLLIVASKKIDITKNKKEGEITSKHPISIFQSNIKQFIENKDDVVVQARKTGFPIYKEQNFYEAIL